jgi:EpsI family protein
LGPQDRDPVNLYIAYYDSQRVGTTTHSPSNCLPGGGWQIVQSRVVSLRLAKGTMLNVTRLVIRKASSAQLVYYWFDERGRNLTESYFAKWFLLWDSIMMRRTDGALVRLITPLTDAKDDTASDERLNDFLNEAYPAIKGFIPGAVVVNNIVVP